MGFLADLSGLIRVARRVDFDLISDDGLGEKEHDAFSHGSLQAHLFLGSQLAPSVEDFEDPVINLT